MSDSCPRCGHLHSWTEPLVLVIEANFRDSLKDICNSFFQSRRMMHQRTNGGDILNDGVWWVNGDDDVDYGEIDSARMMLYERAAVAV